jgi:hypothetical protein
MGDGTKSRRPKIRDRFAIRLASQLRTARSTFEFPNEPFREDWPGQTFSNQERIVAESLKQFPQDFWLFCVTSHPIHLRLELLGSDRLPPVILQGL